MKRFLITICALSVALISLMINSNSACYAAEGYNGNAGYKSSALDQSANQEDNKDENNNAESEALDNAEIIKNAQKWLDNNPEQAKQLEQLDKILKTTPN